MAAQLAPSPCLPLLYEPDLPTRRAGPGWQRRKAPASLRPEDTYERRYADDLYGTQLQHAIARYILHGESRHTLAGELGVSPTNMQMYLRGNAWVTYTRPVLRAFTRLGVGYTKGRRSHGGRQGRYHEIQAASAHLMAQAADVIGGPPLSTLGRAELLLERRRRDGLVRDLRLLAIGSEAKP